MPRTTGSGESSTNSTYRDGFHLAIVHLVACACIVHGREQWNGLTRFRACRPGYEGRGCRYIQWQRNDLGSLGIRHARRDAGVARCILRLDLVTSDRGEVVVTMVAWPWLFSLLLRARFFGRSATNLTFPDRDRRADTGVFHTSRQRSLAAPAQDSFAKPVDGSRERIPRHGRGSRAAEHGPSFQGSRTSARAPATTRVPTPKARKVRHRFLAGSRRPMDVTLRRA